MKNLTGNESFTYNDQPIGKQLIDFWRWNTSDLINNTMRGALAEFIVASALSLNTEESREDWNEFDLLYGKTKIEVKASGYIQSWNEPGKLSAPSFDIAPKYAWNNAAITERTRKADVYVFCLHNHKDNKTANPTRLEQWSFYVLATYKIDKLLVE